VWYCPGTATATGTLDGQADGSLVIANAGSSQATGTILLTPSTGPSTVVPVTVAPLSTAVVHEAHFLRAPYVAATVSFDRGEVAVSQSVAGPLGQSNDSCASTPSRHWYFASGTTVVGAQLIMALYNPFGQDAVADMSFATSNGPSSPSAFQGLLVPARSMVTVAVDQHVISDPTIGTTVNARVGQIVVGKLQLDTIAGESGVSILTAAQAPTDQWWFAGGMNQPGMIERFHLYDPTDRPAKVRVALSLAEGQVTPFELDVQPHGQAVLVTNGQARVPLGDAHAATVSSSGAPIVVERTVAAAASPGGPARAGAGSSGPHAASAALPPSPSGLGDVMGSPVAARRWVVAAPRTPQPPIDEVTLYNPGDHQAVASIGVLSHGQLVSIAGASGVSVAPHQRTLVVISSDLVGIQALELMVSASSPIVVEREVDQAATHTFNLTLAVPIL
jgi:hypothetical protein